MPASHNRARRTMEAMEVLMALGVYVAGAYGLCYAADWAWWKYVDSSLRKVKKENRRRGEAPGSSFPRGISTLA